tara:strand:- start:8 stop:244 length:237 start_codon:yes stop_codon:yes gene_type:complete
MTYDIGAHIVELQKEAGKYDDEFGGFELALITGVISAYTNMMYRELPDDHFLKEHIPAQLADKLDDIKQRAVMKKLES